MFERIFSNAKLAGVLKEGDAFSNEKMIEISDNIYQSITSDQVFASLFDGSDKNNGNGGGWKIL